VTGDNELTGHRFLLMQPLAPWFTYGLIDRIHLLMVINNFIKRKKLPQLLSFQLDSALTPYHTIILLFKTIDFIKEDGSDEVLKSPFS